MEPKRIELHERLLLAVERSERTQAHSRALAIEQQEISASVRTTLEDIRRRRGPARRSVSRHPG